MLPLRASLPPLAALLLFVPLRQDVTPVRVDVLDFDGIAAGTIVSEVHGRFGAGPVLVSGTNPLLGSENAALAFDSSAPTGGDSDLGTPNEDFGGPGVGAGGGAGSPHANRRPLRGILIVGDNLDDGDGDGLVDEPGDADVPGASLLFDFTALGTITPRALTVIDIEPGGSPARVELRAADGALLDERTLPVVGDNGVAVADLGHTAAVATVLVVLNGSAAIDQLVFEQAPRGSLAGRVWNDGDGDGLQDDGEGGLAGVELMLTSAQPGLPVSVTSGTDGSYLFPDLPPGAYVLSVNEATLPAGFLPAPCDVGEDDELDSECSPLALELGPFASLTSVDFGYVAGCTGSIGNFVFNDLDGDNVQSAGDTGVANAIVRLYDGQGLLLETQVTGADGSYLFSGLCSGEYELTVDISNAEFMGFAAGGPVVCDAGDNDDLDSECGPVCVLLFDPLLPGQNEVLNIDFGFGICGQCDGKVDGLSLRYLGSAAAFIEVVQHDGTLVYADTVEPEAVFSVFGQDHQNTLGPNINVFVDGVFSEQIHTSCSQPIFIGMQQGPFEVVAGTSRHGGTFCIR